jgi:ATP-dependent Lon protease
VNKTVSGLLKLLYPDPASDVADGDLEWAVRLGLEMRRRVKEQQKRIGSAEFRNTQFSYSMGLDGVEKFVATPELQSEDSIGIDPLPAGQVWAISPGSHDEGTGLFRIEVNEGPGGAIRILNQSPPPLFRESVNFAVQNLYTRAGELVGDRNPRDHEFSVQLRSFDVAKSAAHTGVPALVALASALLARPLKGGMAVVGGINLAHLIHRLFLKTNIMHKSYITDNNGRAIPPAGWTAFQTISVRRRGLIGSGSPGAHAPPITSGEGSTDRSTRGTVRRWGSSRRMPV